MGWLCANAQSAIASGELSFETKPLSTDGCQYQFTSIPIAMNMIVSNSSTPFDDNFEE